MIGKLKADPTKSAFGAEFLSDPANNNVGIANSIHFEKIAA